MQINSVPIKLSSGHTSVLIPSRVACEPTKRIESGFIGGVQVFKFLVFKQVFGNVRYGGEIPRMRLF